LEGGGGSKPQSQAFVVGEIFVFVTVLLDALQKFERLLFNNIRYIEDRVKCPDTEAQRSTFYLRTTFINLRWNSMKYSQNASIVNIL